MWDNMRHPAYVQQVGLRSLEQMPNQSIHSNRENSKKPECQNTKGCKASIMKEGKTFWTPKKETHAHCWKKGFVARLFLHQSFCLLTRTPAVGHTRRQDWTLVKTVQDATSYIYAIAFSGNFLAAGGRDEKGREGPRVFHGGLRVSWADGLMGDGLRSSRAHGVRLVAHGRSRQIHVGQAAVAVEVRTYLPDFPTCFLIQFPVFHFATLIFRCKFPSAHVPPTGVRGPVTTVT